MTAGTCPEGDRDARPVRSQPGPPGQCVIPPRCTTCAQHPCVSLKGHDGPKCFELLRYGEPMGWFIFFVLLFVGSTVMAIALTSAQREAERNPEDPFEGVSFTPWSMVSGNTWKQIEQNVQAETDRSVGVAFAWAISFLSAIAALIAGVSAFG